MRFILKNSYERSNVRMKKLFKYAVFTLIILGLCNNIVSQSHHHDCSGNIHFSLSLGCSHAAAYQNHFHKHNSDSHSHPCSKDCSVNSIKVFAEENVQKFSVLPLNSLSAILHHINEIASVYELFSFIGDYPDCFRQLILLQSYKILRGPPRC